jgi:flagellar protein FlbD
MIVVTRLNDSQFAINPDLIERIHETPDTTLVMVDGAKYIVRESMVDVIDLVARYRSRIVALAYVDDDEQVRSEAPARSGRVLELVTAKTEPALPSGSQARLVDETRGR